MHNFDVFNGDADGILARHQWRLARPCSLVTLISGTKRDIALLQQVPTLQTSTVTVFDISYDRNVDATNSLLRAGTSVTYFDHHSANSLPAAGNFPRLTAHIDTSADVCTSLIVDRQLGHRYPRWAIAAAFGDNLHAVADALCTKAGLSVTERNTLRDIGEAINYNAYGDSVADLLFTPQQVTLTVAPYVEPSTFMQDENLIAAIQQARRDDVSRAREGCLGLGLRPIGISLNVANFSRPW